MAELEISQDIKILLEKMSSNTEDSSVKLSDILENSRYQNLIQKSILENLKLSSELNDEKTSIILEKLEYLIDSGSYMTAALQNVELSIANSNKILGEIFSSLNLRSSFKEEILNSVSKNDSRVTERLLSNIEVEIDVSNTVLRDSYKILENLDVQTGYVKNILNSIAKKFNSLIPIESDLELKNQTNKELLLILTLVSQTAGESLTILKSINSSISNIEKTLYSVFEKDTKKEEKSDEDKPKNLIKRLLEFLSSSKSEKLDTSKNTTISEDEKPKRPISVFGLIKDVLLASIVYFTSRIFGESILKYLGEILGIDLNASLKSVFEPLKTIKSKLDIFFGSALLATSGFVGTWLLFGKSISKLFSTKFNIAKTEVSGIFGSIFEKVLNGFRRFVAFVGGKIGAPAFASAASRVALSPGIVAKSLGFILKRIPYVSAIAYGISAIINLFSGEYAKAGIDLLAGGASLLDLVAFPLGTILSFLVEWGLNKFTSADSTTKKTVFEWSKFFNFCKDIGKSIMSWILKFVPTSFGIRSGLADIFGITDLPSEAEEKAFQGTIKEPTSDVKLEAPVKTANNAAKSVSAYSDNSQPSPAVKFLQDEVTKIMQNVQDQNLAILEMSKRPVFAIPAGPSPSGSVSSAAPQAMPAARYDGVATFRHDYTSRSSFRLT